VAFRTKKNLVECCRVVYIEKKCILHAKHILGFFPAKEEEEKKNNEKK
jgi:hypothetical protein